MTLTELLIPTYRQMLQALAVWLRKAEAQVDDADALMAARLAPDMFPLSTQIRFACVQAYEGAYRLRHKTMPSTLEALLDEGRNGGDQPGTMAEALARIDEALSQFYFHLMTAYAILRNQGVELGKADYVQHMFAFLRPGTAPAG
jgi:hypothetical protein